MNFLCPSDPSFSAVKLCNLLTSSGKNCPKLSKWHKFYFPKSHQQWWNFQNLKANLLKLVSSKAAFAFNKRWISVLQLSRCSYSWHSCICLQFSLNFSQNLSFSLQLCCIKCLSTIRSVGRHSFHCINTDLWIGSSAGKIQRLVNACVSIHACFR